MAKDILLIEDDEALRTLFKQVLIAAGHDITQAESRETALALLVEHDYEMLITDIQLEDGDTLDIIRVCAQHGLDVVVITSNDSHKSYCQDVGVLAFVPKPVLARDLMTLVNDPATFKRPDAYVNPRVAD